MLSSWSGADSTRLLVATMQFTFRGQGLDRDELAFELRFDARERLGLLRYEPRYSPEFPQLMRCPDPPPADALLDESLSLAITRCEPQGLLKAGDLDLDRATIALELI